MTRSRAAILGIGLLLAGQAMGEEAGSFKTQEEKQDYAVGVDLARKLRRQGIGADADALARGVRDELSGGTLLLTEDELRAALADFQVGVKARRAQLLGSAAQRNRQRGEAFLAQNRAKEGVVTLPSGLQYKILKEGQGRRPTKTDTVLVNYRGTLIDGTEFDNSYSRGLPSPVKVGGVIPGWAEALQLMPVGSQWQLFVPSDLAYGEKGHDLDRRAGRKIGPNETLIFRVELVAIQ